MQHVLRRGRVVFTPSGGERGPCRPHHGCRAGFALEQVGSETHVDTVKIRGAAGSVCGELEGSGKTEVSTTGSSANRRCSGLQEDAVAWRTNVS